MLLIFSSTGAAKYSMLSHRDVSRSRGSEGTVKLTIFISLKYWKLKYKDLSDQVATVNTITLDNV